MMTIATLLAYIVAGNIGGLLIEIVGLVLAFCIIFFIMRTAGAPPMAYTVLYIFLAVVALLMVIDLFFNGGSIVTVR
jgi:hypothetical protein